jgi:hypothetical protein
VRMSPGKETPAATLIGAAKGNHAKGKSRWPF